MKKTFLTLLGILTCSVGIVLFILKSNDHTECETNIETVFNDKGEKVTTETHICKETYNM